MNIVNKYFKANRLSVALSMFAISCLMFVLIEGLSSVAISMYQAFQESKSEVTQYDPLLGWVGKSGVFSPDHYGEGKFVATNSSGFRNVDETNNTVQEGKVRIICSGDSFTYGQGVANNFTWCHQLSKINEKFETVNMGQSGYGVDQMYLRYVQQGLSLEHSIHIFAFVAGDLNRMRLESKNGYGKPTLRIDEVTGNLISNNVPVPRVRWSAARFVERANFRSVQFFQRVWQRLIYVDIDIHSGIERIDPIASKVFQNIQEFSNERRIVPVFVYIPTEQDLAIDLPWRFWALKIMKELELTFVDLTPELRVVSASDAKSFFIPESDTAVGHYTEIGNSWLAETMDEKLDNIPKIRQLLIDTL